MAEPYCLALVLCDATHRDPSTNKFSLLGTFDTFAAKQFPTFIRLGIYFAVTDGMGPCRLCIQLVDAESGAVDATHEDKVDGRIFHAIREEEFVSPLAVLEESLDVGFQIPKEGIYHCELWANDIPLMSRRFTVEKFDETES